MKLIIAGGRHFDDAKYMLNCLIGEEEIMKCAYVGTLQIVSGTAPGADTLGEAWGKAHGCDILRFPADWARYKRGAGPIRNAEMAKEADALALFPGDRGTQSMFNEATKAGIKIYDFREKGNG